MPNTGTHAPVLIDFTALLFDTLSYTSSEFVSLAYQEADGVFRTAVGSPARAPAYADTLPRTANIFFGVNPVAGPARTASGRGEEADVTRLAALWCDLDIQTRRLRKPRRRPRHRRQPRNHPRHPPVVTVDSGHGLHAYWPISDGQIGDGGTAAARARWVRRWGRAGCALRSPISMSPSTTSSICRA